MDANDEDYVYPTSRKRLFMMRALALGFGLLMVIMLVFALAI